MKPRPTTTRSGRSGLCGLEAAQLRVAIFAGIAIAVFSFVTSMALFTTTTPSPAPRRFIVVPDVADERLTAIVATALEAERPVLWTRAAAVASPRTIKPKPGKYPAAVVPLVTQRPVAKASNLIQHEESLDPRAVVLPDFLQKIEGGVVTSKLASRSDMDHDSCKAALGFMAKGFVYHRKSWEFCTIFHVADSLNLLKEGSKALGFAVGTEPLPSAFAARGVTLTLSDMPLENELATSWGKTRQHAASLEAAHKPKILPFEDFKRRATFVPVDMNHVPAALLNESFDFVWSSSSLEHVGSCKRAVRFFKRSLNAVRPDGYVIHTTEIALSSLTDKRDIPGLCIFTKGMLEDLIRDLTLEGHTVLPMQWGIGEGAKYDFDVPPYYSNPRRDHMALWDRHAALVHTSVLLIVRKGINATRPNGGVKPREPTSEEKAWLQSRLPLDMALVPPKFRLPVPSVAYDDITIDRSFLPPNLSRLEPAPRGKAVSRLCNRWDYEDGYCWNLLPHMDEARHPHLHRKQWEFCEMVHALNATGVLQPGKRGLGFAVGQEPLASFFVSKGATVVVSDMPQSHQEMKGWKGTAQHAAALEATWRKKVVDWDSYKSKASYTPIDMNRIPEELQDASFDFTWSSSSLEHVGTCEKGLVYFMKSLRTLKPGGIALHTTELTVSAYDAFVDAPHLCFFSRGMMEGITTVLKYHGHEVLGDDDGNVVMKLGVRNVTDYDRPPFARREHMALLDLGVVHTSIMFVVKKAGSPRGPVSFGDLAVLPRHNNNHPAAQIPLMHLGRRPFTPQGSMLAHMSDMGRPECRSALRLAKEPVDYGHRRHWEICAVLSLVESRGDLAGKGRFVVGFDAAQEPLAMVFAANSTDVLITFPVNSSAYRPQFNMSRQAYLARVRQIETGHNAAPVIAPEDVNSRPDFMWSLAMTSATSCSNALQAVKQNLQLLRPGGVAAFVFSVSLGGDGFDDKTMCVLPYPALLVFAGELRKLGYDVKDPLPQVAEAHQAFDFDSPPYSHVDHMVFSFEGQMVTSSLLVITTKAPATSETTVTDASS